MYITDNNIIDKATPLYPELMSKNAESKIKKLFYDMKAKEKELSKARMQVHSLEQEVKTLQDSWRKQSAMFDIEFAKKEIQEIKEQVFFGIVNPDDYRNHD